MLTPAPAPAPDAEPLDLLTDELAGDPVLDVALTHALLDQVAAGARPATLRLARPGPTVAFGRLDALKPGFAAAAAAARRHGRTPLVRSAGGHAAAYDERSLVVEHVTPEPHVAEGLHERFARQSALLRAALRAVGADAEVGELPREYCPGAHSLHVGGRLKVVGIAQRAIKGAALTTAVVVVGGGDALRAVVADVYAALGLDVDPATAGALDEVLPGVTTGDVAGAIRAGYAAGHALRPAAAGGALLRAARGLAGRHRVP